MPNLVHVNNEELYGEMEGMYDADTGELIHEWACNDASWRGEYLEAIFEPYGFKFIYTKKVQDQYNKLFAEYIKKTYDCECNWDEDAAED